MRQANRMIESRKVWTKVGVRNHREMGRAKLPLVSKVAFRIRGTISDQPQGLQYGGLIPTLEETRTNQIQRARLETAQVAAIEHLRMTNL